MQHVGLITCINLAHRQDRRTQSQELFASLGVGDKVMMVDAAKHMVGFIGCTQSHIRALDMLMASGVEYGAIFEDDIMLTVAPEEALRVLDDAFLELKGDFDVLFVTMTPIRLSPTKMDRLHRVHAALAMPALIVKREYMHKLRLIYEGALLQRKPHDLITQLYQRTDKWYGIFPAIARQRPGFSDIEQREVDYYHLDVAGQMLNK